MKTKYRRVNKIVTLSLSASSLLAFLVGSLATPSSAFARNRSAFNPDEIEQAITEVYSRYDAASENLNQKPDLLKDGDNGRLAIDLFDEIALLRTDQYNDVLGHLLVDYRQHPEDRRAIDAILSALDAGKSDDPSSDAVRQALRDELKNNRERSALITIVDDTLLAFTLASTFQFGKGLWVSRGSGLVGLDRFKRVVENVSENVNVLRKAKVALAVGGAGAAAGIAQAVYQSLETKKLDPHGVLVPIQAAIVHDLAVRAATRRDELRAMFAQNDDDLRSHQAGLRARMTELDGEVNAIQKELAHLYLVSPQLRSEMAPIRQDLLEIRAKIAQLGNKLDSLELLNELN